MTVTRLWSRFSGHGRTSVVLGTFVLLLASATASGQTSTSAILQGTVTSTDGANVPQAHIELVHIPTGSVYRVSAGGDGRFFLAGLRVGGPYTLKVSHIGFATQVKTGIYLRLLENAIVTIALRQRDVTGEEVVVTGSRTDIPLKQLQGASSSVERTQLELLPLPSASLEDAYRISPYMVGQNALGLNASYNDVSLDGIGIVDQYGLQHSENIPGSMQIGPVNLESLQEVRVDLSPFDVRRSGFTGAAIAAVSRSGSNVLSGSVHAQGTGGSWVGRNPDDGRSDFGRFLDGRAGFRIGGPIVESRAFFFATGEISAIRLPVERRFDASRTQGSTYSFSPDNIARMQSRLVTAYGYDPGRMDAVQLDRQSATFFARLDVDLLRGHRLSMRYNFLESRSDRPPYGTTVFAEGALARNATRVHAAIAELNSVFSPRVSNELLVGFTSRNFGSTPQGMPFPFVDVIVTDRLQWWNHLTAGSEIGGTGEHVLQDHLEVHNNTSVNIDDHFVTFGLQGDLHWFTNRLLSSGWGRYTFASMAGFMQGQPSDYEYRYSRDSASDGGVRWRALQVGAFLQDEWLISPAVSVSLGLRVDLPIFPDRPKENEAVRDVFLPLGLDVATSSIPGTRALFSPRIGVRVYPKEDHSILVRGGVGIFTGRIPYAWIGNQYDHTGVDYRHVKVSAGAPAFVADPLRQPVPGPGSTLLETAEIVVTDRNFVLPQEVRWTIGLDQQLPWNLLLSLEGVYSRTLNGIVFKNINLKPSGALSPVVSADERPLYGISLPQGRWFYSRNDSRFTDVMYMGNGNTGSSTFLTVQLQRRPDGDGFFSSVAYSTGDTRDLNSGSWDNAYDQWRYNPAEQPNEPRLNYSSFDRSHRFAAAISFQHEWAPGLTTSAGLVYTGVSGMPYSYVYDGDLNGDGESLNDLFYIPGRYDEILLVDNSTGELLVPTEPAYNQLFEFIVHDDYLSHHRRQVAERNGARSPWSHQLDLRLAQTLPLAESGSLEVQAEVLNVLNLLNASWGLMEYVPYQVVPVLRFYRVDVAGRPLFQWAPRTTPVVSDPLLSRWRIRLGMKYSFG